MNKSFLGKPVPELSPAFKKKRRRTSLYGALLMAIPFAAFSFFISAHPQYVNTPDTAQRAVGPAVIRTFAAVAPIDACEQVINDPANGLVQKGSGGKLYFSVNKLFPFIPDVLHSNSTGCTPEFWNRAVIFYFIYKALIILNWLAGTLALILTVYAGLLYLGGFASENTVKKAKALLIATYTGLAIVILARLLVYSAVDLFTNNDAEKTIQSNPPVPIFSDNPNP